MPLKTTEREKLKGKLRGQACINCEYLVSPVFNNQIFCDHVNSYHRDDMTHDRVFKPEEEWCDLWEKKHN